MVAPNRFELEQWGRQAAKAYLNGGVPLNNSIAKIASDQGFSRDHVERVVQSANSFTNGLIVREKRASKEDPRVSFEMASTDSIMKKAGSTSPTRRFRDHRREDALNSLFSVPEPKLASASDDLEGFFPDAVDPLIDQRGPVPSDLGRCFLFDREAATTVAKVASYSSIQDAIDELKGVFKHAVNDGATMIDAGAISVGKMTEVVDGELLNKTHPLHLRELAKHAGLNEDTLAILDDVIGDRVEKLAVYVPKDAPPMPDNFLVNKEHPLFVAAGGLEKIAEKRTENAAIQESIKSAIDSAKSCLRDAVLETA